MCSLYAMSSDGKECGQSDLKCAYTKFAKAFKRDLKDGTCAEQGYTEQSGTNTLKVPVVGAITVAQYIRPSSTVLESLLEDSALSSVEADMCSLYAMSSDGKECGQSDLKCAYTKFAKAFKRDLKDGTCAEQGYTEQSGTNTLKVPVVGTITVAQYSRPSSTVPESLLEDSALSSMEADMCSLYAMSSD